MDGAAAHTPAVSASLYQRLGGAATVAAVIDDAIDRHAANPLLAHRFREQDLPQIKTLGVGFLSAGAGGPCVDQAAPRATPQHAGMRFCPAEMQAVLGDIADALIEQGVGAAEVAEVLRLFRVISGQQAETSLSRNATGNESGTRAL